MLPDELHVLHVASLQLHARIHSSLTLACKLTDELLRWNVIGYDAGRRKIATLEILASCGVSICARPPLPSGGR